MKLISGTANEPLASSIAEVLDVPLTQIDIERFRDQEIFAKINENVRGEDIFLIQPTSAPANDHLMELLILIDALVRASAKRITAVIPYYGYARQDRKTGGRTPISAKLVANLISKAGAHRVLTADLHAGQIQGFFDIPTDNLFGQPVFVSDIRDKFSKTDRKNLLFVSPDTGGVVRTRSIAKQFGADIAIVDKRRPKPGQSQVMNVIGDVKGKTCVIVDDIIDSGGTIVNAAKALKDRGAKEVYVYITHGVLSGEAVKKIKSSVIKNLVITDTIDNNNKIKSVKNIEVLPISGLMGEAIKRISNSTSVSDLFK